MLQAQSTMKSTHRKMEVGLSCCNEKFPRDSTNLEVTSKQKEHVQEESCTSSIIEEDMTYKSKKSIKKEENHRKLLEKKQAARAEKRKAKRKRDRESRQKLDTHGSQERLSKREDLEQKRKKLQDALTGGQRVCIDLSMSTVMSLKEIGKLAQQIGRVYGANKKADKPVHLILAYFEPDSKIYQACVQKNEGFNNYFIEKSDKSLLELFTADEVIYLSPDSEQVLEFLDESKVYVIGGLVDENPIKFHTLNKAKKCKLATARLPIEEYMERVPHGSYNKILSVNQVFEILLNFYNGKDWSEALVTGVPQRKGFVAKCKPDG